MISGMFHSMATQLATAAEPAGRSFWMPEEASKFAAEMDFVFYFITWLCAIFFVGIVGVLIYFMVKYRRRSHVANVPSITHNTPLELTWTILPLILVIAIFYVGMKGYVKLRQPPIGAYEIQVSGAKWQWTFSYPQEENLTDTELFVPLGRPVRLVMRSEDVLHSMFIPVFRVKQDVVPGRYTDLWFEATRVGEYDVICAEYCGDGHSTMTTRVHVLEEEDFRAAIEEKKKIFDNKPDDVLAYLAFTKLMPRCQSCHTTTGRDGIGPTWRGLWDRTQKGETIFTDGTKLADLIGQGRLFATPEDYIRQSILNPQQKIVENRPASMPTFKGQLTDQQIHATILLLKTIEQVVNEDGEWIGRVPTAEELQPTPEGGAAPTETMGSTEQSPQQN